MVFFIVVPSSTLLAPPVDSKREKKFIRAKGKGNFSSFRDAEKSELKMSLIIIQTGKEDKDKKIFITKIQVSVSILFQLTFSHFFDSSIIEIYLWIKIKRKLGFMKIFKGFRI